MRLSSIWWVLAVAACGGGNKAADAKNRRCAEAVADGKVAEARDWLGPAHDDHRGFEVGLDEMRELAERFYTAGATKVSASYDVVEDVQVSALLVIDLPASKAARTAVFAVHAEIAPRLELDAASDVGQRCLLVGLD
jgi:hypothetical protein